MSGSVPTEPQPTILPRCFIQALESGPAFVSDVVLDCSDTVEMAQNVRVAFEGSAAAIAATVGGQPVLLRTSENGGELEVLPIELTHKNVHLATGAAGQLALLSDTTGNEDFMVEGAGDLRFFTRDADGWRSEQVFDETGWLTPHGFELAADGTPHAWFSVAPPTMYKLAQRGSDGAWALSDVSRSSEQSMPHWALDRAGKMVEYWIETTDAARQLVAEVDGTRIALGPASTITGRYQPMLLASSAGASGTPAFAALVHTESGITAAWPDGSGGVVERELAGTAFRASSCALEPSDSSCVTECTDVYDSVEPGESAFVQTSDGTAWVIWLETHVDRAFTRQQSCTPTFVAGGPGPPLCHCSGMLASDESTATLHVARLDFPSAELTEVTSMALPGLRYGSSPTPEEPRFFDARASGERIAIGLRLGAWKAGEEQPHVHRLMLLDASKL